MLYEISQGMAAAVAKRTHIMPPNITVLQQLFRKRLEKCAVTLEMISNEEQYGAQALAQLHTDLSTCSQTAQIVAETELEELLYRVRKNISEDELDDYMDRILDTHDAGNSNKTLKVYAAILSGFPEEQRLARLATVLKSTKLTAAITSAILTPIAHFALSIPLGEQRSRESDDGSTASSSGSGWLTMSHEQLPSVPDDSLNTRATASAAW